MLNLLLRGFSRSSWVLEVKSGPHYRCGKHVSGDCIVSGVALA